MTEARDPRSPEDVYRVRLHSIRSNLCAIAQAVDEHILECGAAPHWGHVGDLASLDETLTQARRFIRQEEE